MPLTLYTLHDIGNAVNSLMDTVVDLQIRWCRCVHHTQPIFCALTNTRTMNRLESIILIIQRRNTYRTKAGGKDSHSTFVITTRTREADLVVTKLS